MQDGLRPWDRAGMLLVVLFAAIALVPVFFAPLSGPSDQNIVYNAGRNFALIGFMLLILQVFLAARLRWIEQPFGLDIILRFHRNMGIFSLILLLAHPILLAAGIGSFGLIVGLKAPWYIWTGRVTLLVLLVSVLISVFQTSFNIKFEDWRTVHDILNPLVLVLAFVHGVAVGKDLKLPVLLGIWTIAFVLAVSLFIYHRIVRPWVRKRHSYTVTEVHPEVKDVWTVKLAPPPGGKVFDYLPGQFQFITFYRGRGLPVEEHHWTISSSPGQKEYVSSTIKALGDFTATIGETQAGDRAAVQAPFGRFTYLHHPDEKDLVFLTGGIGITPLMSMIRHMRDEKDAARSVLLLYGNRQEKEIVFRNELDETAAGGYPRLRVVHVISSPENGWAGETGYVDEKKIRKYCGDDLGGKSFYLCGPPGMIKSLTAALKSMNVPDSMIRMEIFSFL